MKLKDLGCRYAAKRAKDFKLADGGGLYLLVRPTGSKLWRMKYQFGGKEKLLSFGCYPEVRRPMKPIPEIAAPSPLDRAALRHAHVTADIIAMQERKLAPLPHQLQALEASRTAFDTVSPKSARYLEAAILRDPTLLAIEPHKRANALINAMRAEIDLRMADQTRADQFVTRWNDHVRRIRMFEDRGERWRGDDHRTAMDGMVKQLQRDPQLESLLRNRRLELGIKASSGVSIARDLQQWIGRSRGRGIEM